MYNHRVPRSTGTWHDSNTHGDIRGRRMWATCDGVAAQAGPGVEPATFRPRDRQPDHSVKRPVIVDSWFPAVSVIPSPPVEAPSLVRPPAMIEREGLDLPCRVRPCWGSRFWTHSAGDTWRRTEPVCYQMSRAPATRVVPRLTMHRAPLQCT